MTQEERWLKQYREVMEFIETNHRNPSKYRAEERNYYNFVKRCRKMRNARGLVAERLRSFEGLMTVSERYKHNNQYE
jgi:hypothetical protein